MLELTKYDFIRSRKVPRVPDTEFFNVEAKPVKDGIKYSANFYDNEFFKKEVLFKCSITYDLREERSWDWKVKVEDYGNVDKDDLKEYFYQYDGILKGRFRTFMSMNFIKYRPE